MKTYEDDIIASLTKAVRGIVEDVKYPHDMYKGDDVKTAKDAKEHKALADDGYTHEKPVDEVAEPKAKGEKEFKDKHKVKKSGEKEDGSVVKEAKAPTDKDIDSILKTMDDFEDGVQTLDDKFGLSRSKAQNLLVARQRFHKKKKTNEDLDEAAEFIEEAIGNNDILVKKEPARLDPTKLIPSFQYKPASILSALKKAASDNTKPALQGAYIDDESIVHKKSSKTMANFKLGGTFKQLLSDIETWAGKNAALLVPKGAKPTIDRSTDTRVVITATNDQATTIKKAVHNAKAKTMVRIMKRKDGSKVYIDTIDKESLDTAIKTVEKILTQNESLDESADKKLVKKAVETALNMGGDMTGAVKKIEKMMKGLSKDKEVAAALQLANESIVVDDAMLDEAIQMNSLLEDKAKYKAFFDKALKKFGVDSPADLKGDKKKEFFDWVDANYEAENEED